MTSPDLKLPAQVNYVPEYTHFENKEVGMDEAGRKYTTRERVGLTLLIGGLALLAIGGLVLTLVKSGKLTLPATAQTYLFNVVIPSFSIGSYTFSSLSYIVTPYSLSIISMNVVGSIITLAGSILFFNSKGKEQEAQPLIEETLFDVEVEIEQANDDSASPADDIKKDSISVSNTDEEVAAEKTATPAKKESDVSLSENSLSESNKPRGFRRPPSFTPSPPSETDNELARKLARRQLIIEESEKKAQANKPQPIQSSPSTPAVATPVGGKPYAAGHTSQRPSAKKPLHVEPGCTDAEWEQDKANYDRLAQTDYLKDLSKPIDPGLFSLSAPVAPRPRTLSMAEIKAEAQALKEKTVGHDDLIRKVNSIRLLVVSNGDEEDSEIW